MPKEEEKTRTEEQFILLKVRERKQQVEDHHWKRLDRGQPAAEGGGQAAELDEPP